jgi:abortive infection bacteriophage resistance protein
MKFQKPPLDIPGQLQKWQSRGLVVSDPAKAGHFLRFIGYYRLSAYALPFQQPPPVAGQPATGPDKPFKPGTTFDDLLNLYVFDRELRLLVMDAMERIEVALRSCIVNEMCLRHGAHWFMDTAHFSPSYRHNKLIDKIEDELDIPARGNRPQSPHHERFINHYFKKYTDPYLPPAWMIAETLPLGTWSSIYSNLRQSVERKAIAAHFQVDEFVLKNWLHSLTYLRNLCAHHARLWNRQFVIKPVIARKHAGFLKSNDRFYAMAVVLQDLLRIIAPGTTWHQRLAALLNSCPVADRRAMGFPAGWEKEPFWL